MKKILLCSLAIVSLLTSCKEKKRPDLKTLEAAAASSPGANAGAGNFDIDAPAGWQKTDTAFSGVRVTLIISPENANHQKRNINVVTDAMQGASLDKYFDASISTLSANASQYHLIEKGERLIKGSPCRWIHFGSVPKGTAMEQILYIVSAKNIAYLITCTSFKGQMEKDQPLFDMAVNSFHIHQ